MAVAISQDDFLNDTSQFDVARKKAAEQSAASLQQRKDALARRFASLGNLDSGVRLKQEQIATDSENSNLNNANEAINAQQNAELGRRREVIQGQQFQSGEADKQREFARGERLGGQDFASAQANLQRQFQTGERLGGQDFAAGQNALQRQFATSERLGSQGFAGSQADKQREFERVENLNNRQFTAGQNAMNRETQRDQFAQQMALSRDQLDQAHSQFDKTFKEEQRINNANLGFAQQTLDKKGFLETLGGNISSGFKNYTGLGKTTSAIGSIFSR